MLSFTVIPTGPLMVNCTIIYNDKNCIIFDPGGSVEKIIGFLDEKGVVPEVVINTHGHFDHIGAVFDLKNRFRIPFYMSKKDEFLLRQASLHASMFGLPPVVSPDVDFDLTEDVRIENSIAEVIIIETPGHTPGGISFYLKELNLVVTGDTLFAGSVGRTDFPYSDFNELKESIFKLYRLSDKTVVIPGHCEFTTIGDEKRNNPFVRAV